MADKGTCVVEWSRPGSSSPAGFIRFKWTSTTTGNVVYTMPDYTAGRVGRFTTNPGATAPTTGYTVTLTDEDGVDILLGAAANRHPTTTQSVYPTVAGSAGTGTTYNVFAGLLTFNVTNAGTSKIGEATLYYY